MFKAIFGSPPRHRKSSKKTPEDQLYLSRRKVDKSGRKDGCDDTQITVERKRKIHHRDRFPADAQKLEPSSRVRAGQRHSPRNEKFDAAGILQELDDRAIEREHQRMLANSSAIQDKALQCHEERLGLKGLQETEFQNGMDNVQAEQSPSGLSFSRRGNYNQPRGHDVNAPNLAARSRPSSSSKTLSHPRPPIECQNCSIPATAAIRQNRPNLGEEPRTNSSFTPLPHQQPQIQRQNIALPGATEFHAREHSSLQRTSDRQDHTCSCKTSSLVEGTRRLPNRQSQPTRHQATNSSRGDLIRASYPQVYKKRPDTQIDEPFPVKGRIGVKQFAAQMPRTPSTPTRPVPPPTPPCPGSADYRSTTERRRLEEIKKAAKEFDRALFLADVEAKRQGNLWRWNSEAEGLNVRQDKW